MRGDAQILLLLSKKLVRFNALFNVNQKLEQPIDYQTSTVSQIDPDCKILQPAYSQYLR